MELIGTTESHDALFAKLEERWKAYRKQSKTTLLDASEGELWTQYMLPEYDPNMIFANAPKRPACGATMTAAGWPTGRRSHHQGAAPPGLYPWHHRQHRDGDGDPRLDGR